MKRYAWSRRACSSRGAMLVVVIVCLVLATLILGALLKSTLLLSHQQGVEQQRVQAVWLVSAGLARAAYRLRSQPDYTGETWQIAAPSLGTNEAARVKIRVAAPTGQANSRDVVIEVAYPADAARPISLTRQATVLVQQELP